MVQYVISRWSLTVLNYKSFKRLVSVTHTAGEESVLQCNLHHAHAMHHDSSKGWHVYTRQDAANFQVSHGYKFQKTINLLEGAQKRYVLRQEILAQNHMRNRL